MTSAGGAIDFLLRYFPVFSRHLTRSAGISVINSLPAGRLLTETDGPFTEIGNRRSEPRDVTRRISRLAQLRSLSVEEMKPTVTSKAERVLGFAHVSIPVRDW